MRNYVLAAAVWTLTFTTGLAAQTQTSGQAPQNLRVETAEADSVVLTWDSAGSGVSYTVYYSMQNDAEQAIALGRASTEQVKRVYGLGSDAPHYFWVASVSNGAESGKSPVLIARTSPSAVPPVPTEDEDLRRVLLIEAEKHIGVSYSSPPRVPSTFDCSGFVNYVFTKAAGQHLSASSRSYLTIGREISFKDARPGDILVFSSKPGGSSVNHVALLYKKSASGELRGSLLIHAVSLPVQSAIIRGDGSRSGVVISELGKRRDGQWQKEYFLSRYKTTKRFIED
ncbi:C40 family peptidase [Breznakiellaceae bacterium SP9]